MPNILLPLELLLNQYLALDQQTVSALAQLAGKVVCVRLKPLDIKCYFLPTNSGINVSLDSATTPDLTISGSPMALANMHWQNDQAINLLDSGVEVSGDVSLGQSLQAIVRRIDIDWEEHLSTLVGDVLAYNLGSLCKSTKSWCTTTVTSMQHNLRDYLQEESRHLPPAEEINDFLQDVDILRNDAERLFARWALLEKN